MSTRSQRRAERRAEALIKGIGGIVLMIFFTVKFVPGVGERLASFGYLMATAAGLGLALAAAAFGLRILKRRNDHAKPATITHPESAAEPAALTLANQPQSLAPQTEWSLDRIRDELGEIDWFQFELFCGALLRAEGNDVERKGGAHPDGGVDLVALKDGQTTLIQCKHWKTWKVQEKTVRELLGSMAHFGARRGALYTLNAWTAPAERFAKEHAIDLVNGAELAARALKALDTSRLNELLNSRVHHCPKCEKPMVWRTGNFEPFWGCSTFPRCRGTLKHSGAR